MQVTEEKDLGIIIDDELKFKQHINLQTKKANQRLGMMQTDLLLFLINHSIQFGVICKKFYYVLNNIR
jgi:hypothetical protein